MIPTLPDPTNPIVYLASVSPSCQRLVQLMQSIHFGTIENLKVVAGQPVFNPAPRVTREIKFGGDNTPCLDRPSTFVLKEQVVELLQTIESFENCIIPQIQVKHGLPFKLLIRDAVS